MASALRWAAVVAVVFATGSAAQETKYGLKSVKAPPAKQLDESIRKLLDDNAVQFLDPKGDLIAELWFRKEVPSDASPDLVKKGPTYQEIAPSTVLGAVRFAKPWTDYRNQKVKAGVYTMRLGFQPQDGDHMGTAPYPTFALLIAAAEDKGADALDLKKFHEMSANSIGTSHPAVLLLYPNTKPGDRPQLATQPGNQVVLNTREAVRAKGARGVLGISLTLVGHAD